MQNKCQAVATVHHARLVVDVLNWRSLTNVQVRDWSVSGT